MKYGSIRNALYLRELYNLSSFSKALRERYKIVLFYVDLILEGKCSNVARTEQCLHISARIMLKDFEAGRYDLSLVYNYVEM